MTSQRKKDELDRQWLACSPGWRWSQHRYERELLYDVMEDDETINSLIGGRWKIAARPNDGVVVATDRRIIFLYGGRLGKEISNVPYANLDSVSHHTGRSGDRISICGRHIFPGCRIDYVGKKEAGTFVELLKDRLIGNSTTKQTSIDDQWDNMSWGSMDHQGEREMIYNILDDGEQIEIQKPDMTSLQKKEQIDAR